MSKTRVIGLDGALPWRLRDDLKWFKKQTMGKPIIMGRKTYESIGRPLPGRLNIVVSRDPVIAHKIEPAENLTVLGNLKEAFSTAKTAAVADGANEICVVGGGAIYASTLDEADRIYLTEVDAEFDGDTYFPAINENVWRRTFVGEALANDKNDYSCRFFILDRM